MAAPTCRSIIARIVLIAMTGTSATPGTSAAPAPPRTAAPCRIMVPHDLEAGVTSWIGPCRGGAADGIGMLRVQRSLDYSLFLGQAANGRPVTGTLFVFPHAMLAVTRFDPYGHPVSGGTAPADHAAFLLGAQAARQTAAHFAARANTASRDFYQRLATTLSTATSATGYPAGTIAAHAAALKKLRAGLIGQGTLDGRLILSVQPSGHCGTLLTWSGGSHRIEWMVQPNSYFLPSGRFVTIGISDNVHPPRTLRFPRRAAPGIKSGFGTFTWACAPE
ncbi:hypothetical protein ACFSGX_06665 [Sphingomonas arantia]|uniref:Uncharacterized protein n=1 Tax=Sphingomonas arantia TaxID=1460676 RepID=A0ABW4TUT1_9SPHN